MELAKQNINYSQCWEDPRVLMRALAVTRGDVVLSITSGGDNTLALLLEQPKKLISVDFNNTQNYLLELKLSAAKRLSYQEFLEFLGVAKSSRRLILFKEVQDIVSPDAKLWWVIHRSLIENGVIHGGRFEKFLKLFRNFVLPLIHSQKTISKFLSVTDPEQQRKFYRTVWDTRRWRLLFRIFSSRLMLRRFARQPGMFTHVDTAQVGQQYLQRVERNFQTISLKDNYFMGYCMTGFYGALSMPPYLEQKNYARLNTDVTSLIIVNSSLLSYLKSIPENYFSKFNLSDIFEPLSGQENSELWTEIVRTAKPCAIVAYWNNLVPRSFPKHLSKNIADEKDTALQLHKIDRVFFYEGFHINKIIK